MSIEVQLIQNLVIMACLMIAYIFFTLKVLRWLLRPREADATFKEKEN
jgi:hypothetical protein